MKKYLKSIFSKIVFYIRKLLHFCNKSIISKLFICMKKKTNTKMKEKITESRIVVENGKIRTILSEEIQKNGYMTVEESRQLTLEAIKKIYEQP